MTSLFFRIICSFSFPKIFWSHDPVIVMSLMPYLNWKRFVEQETEVTTNGSSLAAINLIRVALVANSLIALI